jgi:hypothetical protein
VTTALCCRPNLTPPLTWSEAAGRFDLALIAKRPETGVIRTGSLVMLRYGTPFASSGG